ncbi:MAG: hypothetical protein HOG34_00935 [Bacteroidetes bacterium]|nr:hypothetical protein [Bacteroidota bacterium]
MDYLVGGGRYYVTEKPKTPNTDNRRRGYRTQTKRTHDSRQKALHWGVLMIQVSREEIEIYVEGWVLKYVLNIKGGVEPKYEDVLIEYFDKFIEVFLVFNGIDTKLNGKIKRGYSSSRVSGEPMYSSARVQIEKPTRDDILNHVSFFLANDPKQAL